MDVTAFGNPIGMIEELKIVNIPCDEKMRNDLEQCANDLKINYKVGVIATGDKFITKNEDRKKIIEDFNALAVEMEGAATGQVCYVNGIKFCVIRAISDGSKEENADVYFNSKKIASDAATSIMIEYLNKKV